MTIPGEVFFAPGDIELNEGAPRLTLEILNTGDRPVQVGSHVHITQANRALKFDRDAAYGRRLDIPAGTAVRFEPGVAQQVSLVPLGGRREVHGISLDPPGRLDERGTSEEQAGRNQQSRLDERGTSEEQAGRNQQSRLDERGTSEEQAGRNQQSRLDRS